MTIHPTNCDIHTTTVAVMSWSSEPTVANRNIGEGVEQKEDSFTAVLLSTLSDEITFAPTGYPHASDNKNIPSARTPNKGKVNDFFGVTARAAMGASSVNGNNAGNTLIAHTVMPSRNFCAQNCGLWAKQNRHKPKEITTRQLSTAFLQPFTADFATKDEEEFILQMYA